MGVCVKCPACEKQFHSRLESLHENIIRCWFCDHIFTVVGWRLLGR